MNRENFFFSRASVWREMAKLWMQDPETSHYGQRMADLLGIRATSITRTFLKWEQMGLVERDVETSRQEAAGRGGRPRGYFRLTKEGREVFGLALTQESS